ncbi:MAG TPA: AAA family ATPase, partial [Acidimicrobiia bacterium]
MIGRVAEGAQLRAAWEAVCAGAAPRAVHLIGEAGIGKSRLCASFVDEVDPAPERCVELRGSPFHASAGFHALRSLLALPGEGDGPPATIDALADSVTACGLEAGPIVPLLAPLSDIPAEAQPTIGLDGRLLREAVADAAYRYLAACLGAGPSVLVVEDLHWCDDATVEVVGRVLRESGAEVLVLTTSREPAPVALHGAIDLSLGPLGPADAERLVRELDPAASAEVCARVVARGDGVPLFLEALVNGREGAETGGVADDGGARPAPAGAVGTGGPVPDPLYELLVSRLYTSPAATRIAAAAATVGTVFETDLLARVAAVPRPEAQCALDGLADGGVLVADVTEGRYRFRHELLREVAYELAPPSRRRDLHGRAATALQEPTGSVRKVDWRLVAGHYENAGQVARAVEAYVAAADDARRLGELADSRGVLDHAVELALRLPEGPTRWRYEVALRLRRGFLAVSVEGNASLDAIEDYERCLEIAITAPASDEMFGTLNALFVHYLIGGRMDRVDQVATMLRDGLGPHPDYAADNMASFGVVRWFTGDFVSAHAHLEEAVAGLLERGTAHHYEGTWFMPTDAWASAHIFLANARFVREAPGADEQVDAALERCAGIEFPQGPYTAALARSYAAWMAVERGDLAVARAAVAEIAVAAQRHGFDQLALVAA